MTDDRMRSPEQELDEFWDALVRGNPQDRVDALDPGIREHILKLHTAAHVATPVAARERSKREIATRLHGQQIMEKQMSTITATPPLSGNGRIDPLRPAWSVRAAANGRPRLTFCSVALTVALVLTTVGIGMYAFGSSFPGRDRPNSIPAAFLTDPPSPEVSGNPIFTVTIPAEAFPTGDQIVHSIVAYSVFAGDVSSFDPYCCSGPVIEYVVEGRIAYTAGAPVQVTRANGAIEEIPAATEVILEPGDGLLTRIETQMEAKNLSAETAIVLTWISIGDDSEGFGGRQYTGWMERSVGFQVWPAAITGPVTFQLEPVTLTVGEEVPIPAGELKLVVVAGSGVRIDRPQTGTETSFTVEGGAGKTAAGYIVTLDPFGSAAASPEVATPTP